MDNVRAYAEAQGIVPILGGEKRIGSTAGQDINFARGRDAPRLFVEGRRSAVATSTPWGHKCTRQAQVLRGGVQTVHGASLA